MVTEPDRKKVIGGRKGKGLRSSENTEMGRNEGLSPVQS